MSQSLNFFQIVENITIRESHLAGLNFMTENEESQNSETSKSMNDDSRDEDFEVQGLSDTSSSSNASDNMVCEDDFRHRKASDAISSKQASPARNSQTLSKQIRVNSIPNHSNKDHINVFHRRKELQKRK